MKLYFDESVNSYYLIATTRDRLDGHIAARGINSDGTFTRHEVPIDEFMEMSLLEFDIESCDIDEIIL
jgi:hypothetical protein